MTLGKWTCMYETIGYGVLFCAALYILIKSSDYFVEFSEKAGILLGIPPFIVGVVIVSVGTSLPELVSSIAAVLQGTPNIVAGNVVGSNIANIFLVLGLAALASPKKIRTEHTIINVDLPFLMGSAFLVSAMMWDGTFSRVDSAISILAGAVYVYYTTTVRDKELEKEMKKEISAGRKMKGMKTAAGLAVTSAIIYFSAKYTITGATGLARTFGVGNDIIGLTALALGTSLPELSVTVRAARKGKGALAVGNVLGSNIFNSFAVMGVPGIITTLPVTAEIISFALPMMIAATLIFFAATQDNEVTKWEGAFLLLFYAFFIIHVF
ncbi:sodium:calcium antiporter [Candidatus Woesearchaeota archaeon]|nr:MAG: sodium:calcium antiporter [Candidatus Woesearchaeota archaeon]